MHHVFLGLLGHQALGRLAACLALLVFSELLRAEPRTGPSSVCTAIRGYGVRWHRLARWMGLIAEPPNAPDRRDRREGDEESRSEKDSLSALELSVVAELNFEIARAYEEVANDASRGIEARGAADTKATALRERADSFLLEAQLLSAEPMLYSPSTEKPASPPTVPERRTRERRTGSRRRDGESAVGPPGGRERRTGPDRRKRDRRGGGVVVGS